MTNTTPMDVYAFLTHLGVEGEENDFLEHYGVKGMRWGVRRDEKKLGREDQALNISQRAQVKVASGISALAAIGMTTNAAATLFQLQARWERLQIVQAIMSEAANNPLIDEAAKQSLAQTKSNVIKGIVGSAMATTAVSLTIGIVTQKAAKAYFAPLHKVYGNQKGKINADIRALSKEVKQGKRKSMTTNQYYAEVSKIVQNRMTTDKSNLLSPFHELARSQLGTEYNTKQLKIKFEKLPNTELYRKMTVTTPHGLKLVKAIKEVAHADTSSEAVEIDFHFDYKFDSEGFIESFSSPTIEVLEDIVNGRLDLTTVNDRYVTHGLEHAQPVDLENFYKSMGLEGEAIEHFGVKGMKWGVRRTDAQLAKASGAKSSKKKSSPETPSKVAVAKKAAFIIAKAAAVPIASSTGVGAIGALGVGIGIRVLSDPTVQSALSDVGKFAKDTFGDIKMSDIIGTESTSKTTEVVQRGPTTRTYRR